MSRVRSLLLTVAAEAPLFAVDMTRVPAPTLVKASARTRAAVISITLFCSSIAAAQTFPVRDMTPLTDNASTARFAVDPSGNTLMLWDVFGPTNALIALRSSRYDVATDTWSAPIDLVRLANASDPKYQFPRLVILPSGDALAVGRAIYGTQYGAQAVVYARYSLSTNTWGPITVLSPPGVNWPVWPSVVVDANGVVTAAWDQICSGCTGQTLHVARYSPASGAWTVQPLDGGLYAATNAFPTQAAIDANGNVLVVFAKSTPPGQTVYARRFSAGTSSWSATEVVATSACDSCGYGQVAVDARGDALVTWLGRVSGTLESIHWDAATATWGAVQAFSSPSLSSKPFDRLVVDATGNFTAAWTTTFSSAVTPTFLVRRFSSTSHTWGPVTTLSATGYWGELAADRSGNVTAVWHHSGSPGGIKGARLDAATGAWSSAVDLATDTASTRGISPDVIADAVGNVRVWWQRYPSSGVGQRLIQSAVWAAGVTPGPPTGPPGPPTSLRATVVGNMVTLSWGAPVSGATATGYTLVGRLTAGGPVLAALPMGTATSFALNAPNGTFVLTVQASNGSGTGPESTPVTVTVPQSATAPPGAPSNLSASVNGTTATFTWNPPASGGPVENYVFLAGASPAFTTPLASLPLGAAPSFTVSGVPTGTYWVRVVARNAVGSSAPSNETSITVAGLTPPGAPTMNAPTLAGQTVGLSWSAGPGGAPASYTLYASVAPGGAPIATAPLTGTSVSFANVPNGIYYLKVTASNAAGTSAPSTEVAAVVGPPSGASLLPLVNAWRTLTGLPALVEEPSWSAGAKLHSQYVLGGNSDQSFDPELPGRIGYTAEGNDAAQNSVLFYSLFFANFSPTTIVSSWARSPFVSVQMLDPRLQRTGLGYATMNLVNVQRTSAVFDVVRGRNTALPIAAPTTFPRQGSAIVGQCAERTSYAACGSEGYPPVLDPCGIVGNGFTTPDFGMPVWIQFGPGVTPVVTASSLSNGATTVPICTVTPSSYTVSTPAWQTLGRKILADRGAVILVPKVTLPSGKTYTASVTVNGQQYQWSFTVIEP